MLTNGCRPNHQSLLPLRRGFMTRRGFTLIELILVVLIMLILLTLTVAVVGNVLDNDRVRGASRQVKNYLAGARDRAIYSASRVEVGANETPPRVGVRFLADSSLMVPDALGNPVYRGFSSMVFVQENRPIGANISVWKDSSTQQWYASQYNQATETPPGSDSWTYTPPTTDTLARVGGLIERGLVETRIEPWAPNPHHTADALAHYIPVIFSSDGNRKLFYIRFFDDRQYSGNIFIDSSTGWLKQGQLSAPVAFSVPPDSPVDKRYLADVTFGLLPSPLPSEEPRLLPNGTIIEVQSSVVGSGPKLTGSLPMNVSLKNLARADGSFDIMFNAQGVVDGPIAAAGLVHLVIADMQDIERGFGIAIPYEDTSTTPSTHLLFTGSPFLDDDDNISNGVLSPLDEDGDLKPDERQGDVRIVSIRTQTGGVTISHVYPNIDSSTNRFVDPFRFAETGEEAP